MNRISAAVFALALAAGSAFAADLPLRKGPPAFAPPPVFSWTGLYGGVNIGYGFGNGDSETGAQTLVRPPFGGRIPARAYSAGWSLPTDLNGVVGGGQLGYNIQYSPWLVLGLEADIQAADLRSHGHGVIGLPSWRGGNFASVESHQSVDWYGTVRGRVGVTPFDPHLMIYGTGGFAYGQVNRVFNKADVFLGGPGLLIGNAVYDDTKVGWTAGGGVEWTPAALPSWSVKVEYLYVDLGSTTLAAGGLGAIGAIPAGTGFTAIDQAQTRFHTVKAGLNYHFNLAPFPVIARY
jgi:opacity protein-like surface antigen